MGRIFSQCCCCVSLETGGFVIGWICIVGGILGFIYSFITIGKSYDIPDKGQSLEESLDIIKLLNLIFSLISPIAGYFLNYGIHKKYHKKVIWMLAMIALWIVHNLIVMLILFSPEAIVIFVIASFFNVYIFLCIYSLYVKIRDEKDLEGVGAA